MRLVRLQWFVALATVLWIPGLAQAGDVYQELVQLSTPGDSGTTQCSAWEMLDQTKDEVPAAPVPAATTACQPQACAMPKACAVETCGAACDPCNLSCCQRPLLRRGIEIDAWMDQGLTFNPASPINRFNGPVTFNDRSNEYQMNQLWLSLHRDVQTDGQGFDIGGGLDLNYGTDSRFMWANGLDNNWSDSHRFYGLSMPQLYLDLGWNDLTVRIGHFCSIIGYEKLQAPENFFYSHSYMKQYAEPFTNTGALFMYPLGSQWQLSAGVVNGWNQWSGNDDYVGFLGGATWTSYDKRQSLAFACTTSKVAPYNDSDLFMYSLVYQRNLTQRLQWVLQNDYAYQNDVPTLNGQDAEWYGFATYLYYDINCRWSAGLRYEWFSDDDGVRVIGMGYPHGINLAGVPCNWQEITAGVNYKPTEHLTVRSECRWDWADPLVTVTDGPFDDYNALDQFLFSVDVILQY